MQPLYRSWPLLFWTVWALLFSAPVSLTAYVDTGAPTVEIVAPLDATAITAPSNIIETVLSSRDSFSGYLEDPLSQNPYLYGNADPVNNWDPSGYETVAEVQAGSTIQAQIELIHTVPRFRKARQAFCAVAQAKSAYDQAQNLVQQMQMVAGAAQSIGAAAGAGFAGGFGTAAATIFFQEVFDLQGLDAARLFSIEQGKMLEAIYNDTDFAPMSAPEFEDSQRWWTPCFAAGTLVSTETGLRPIETIEVGDKVWSMGQGTVELALKPVTQTFVSQVTNLVILTLGDETITTTPEHPFWVKDEGWVKAGLLKLNDHLLGHNENIIRLKYHEFVTNIIAVYNLEVQDFHNYFVGISNIYVHNTPPNYGITRQHGNVDHWQRILRVVAAMRRNGWTDIRVNQTQVDALLRRVGLNRPDVSGINPQTNRRQNLEFDHKINSSQRHRNTLINNDRAAKNTCILLK